MKTILDRLESLPVAYSFNRCENTVTGHQWYYVALLGKTLTADTVGELATKLDGWIEEVILFAANLKKGD